MPAVSPIPSTPQPPQGPSGPVGGQSVKTPLDSLSQFETYDLYLRTVMSSSRLHGAAVADAASADSEVVKQVYYLFFEKINALADASEKIRALAKQEQEIRQMQLDLNAAIAQHNTNLATLEQLRTNLNAAITAYNSVVPPTPASVAALQAAINTYNNAIRPLVSPLDQLITQYNAIFTLRNQINAERQALGMPPLSIGIATPSQIPYDGGLAVLGIIAGSSPPLPLVVPAFINLPTVTVIPQGLTPDGAVAKYFPSISKTISEAFASMDVVQQVLVSTLIAKIFQTSGLLSTVPDAYIDRFPTHSLDIGEGVALGNSVASASLSVGLSSPSLSIMMSEAMFDEYAIEKSTPIPPRIVDQLQLVAWALLGPTAAVAASSPALQQVFVDKGLDTRRKRDQDRSLEIDRAIAFSGGIRNLVNSDVVNEIVKQIIFNAPELSDLSSSQKQELIDPLSAIIKQGLLQVGLNQISVALGAPGLPAQVLGNVTGVPPLSQTFDASNAVSLATTLENPFSVVGLKEKLSLELVKTGISKTQADILLNPAVNVALSNTLSKSTADISEEAFSRELASALAGKGVSPATMGTLVQAASQYLKTERPYFIGPFSSGILNELFSGRVDPARIEESFPSGTVRRNALNAFIRNELFRPQVADAVRAAIGQPALLIRDFRDNFNSELLARGVTAGEANRISNNATQIFAPEPSTETLLETQPQTLLRPPALVEAITGRLEASASTLGESRVPEIQQQVSRLIVGIISDYNEQLRILRESNQEKAIQRFYENLDRSSVVNYPKIALEISIDRLVQKYMQPAARDNLTTNNPFQQPTGWWKRDIAI